MQFSVQLELVPIMVASRCMAQSGALVAQMAASVGVASSAWSLKVVDATST